MTGAELTVVVVAYGRDDLLADAVEGVSSLRVVVVDNARSDSCHDVVTAAGATYLRPGSNLGFAGGVNHALESGLVVGDVLLHNPDARIDERGVRRVHEALHAPGRRIACVSPRLTYSGSGDEQRVTWPFPRPGTQALVAVGLGRLTHRPDFLVGAVLMLRADALAEVGPFDERFFLYCEETDWQRRAADAGWERVLVDSVTAEHVGGASSAESDRQQAYFHAADELYVRKWFGNRGWSTYRSAAILGCVVRVAVGRGDTRTRARRRLQILLRGPVRHRDELLARAS